MVYRFRPITIFMEKYKIKDSNNQKSKNLSRLKFCVFYYYNDPLLFSDFDAEEIVTYEEVELCHQKEGMFRPIVLIGKYPPHGHFNKEVVLSQAFSGNLEFLIIFTFSIILHLGHD